MTSKESLKVMRPIKQDNMYYCANCGCDVGSYGLASGKMHMDMQCRACGTMVDWSRGVVDAGD